MLFAMGKRLLLGTLALSLTLPPQTSQLAFAAAADTTTATASGVEFFKAVPPAFNAAKGQQMANIFSSCLGAQAQLAIGSVGQSIQNISNNTGGFGLTIGAGTVCPQPGGDVPKNLTCEKITAGEGYDPALVKKFKDSLDASLTAAQCSKGKFMAIQAELSCLSSQADILTQQTASLQEAYVDNIQKMQGDIQQYNAYILDRDIQVKDAKSKLGGTGDTGERGLLDVKRDFQNVVNQMPVEVQSIKEEQKLADQQRKGFLEQVQSREAALALECFGNQKKSSFKCRANGEPVTAKEYVLCRYEQNQFISKDGTIERDAKTKIKAESKAKQLSSVLDQIFGDAPSSSKLPTSPQEFQANADQPVNVLNMADIQKQYGEKLSRFNEKGLDINSFIMKQMGACFSRATKQVNRERKRANSAIGVAEFKIKEAERATSVKVNQLLNKYSQSFDEVTSTLTGASLPLDVSACRKAKPAIQANCLEDLKQNMDGMLNGNVPQSAVKIAIKGNDSKNNVIFQCKGLNGCIRTLQNVARNLEVEKGRVEAEKQKYVANANANVERFTKQMASALSPQSQALNNRLKELNTALASLGVGGGIKIDPVRCEKPRQEEIPSPVQGIPPSKLFSVPESAINVVGCQMNPPMLDISGNTFAGGLQGISTGISKADDKAQDIQEKLANLESLHRTCPAKPVKELANSLQGKVDELLASNCGDVGRHCGQSNNLKAVVESIRSIASEERGSAPGLNADAVENLATGIEGACGEEGKDTRFEEERRALASQRDEANASGDAVTRASVLSDVRSQERTLAGEERRLQTDCKRIFTSLSKSATQLKNAAGKARSDAGAAF